MLSIQTSIALQIIGTLSPDELQAFSIEFEKIKKPVSKTKPKKREFNIPAIEVLAAQKLQELQLKKQKHPDASQSS